MSVLTEYKRVSAIWPNADASEFLHAGRLLWHVQRNFSANDQAPILLLLHGTGASSHSWVPLLEELSRDFRVIAPDLPGHGYTERPSLSQLSLQGMSTLLASLLTTLDVSPDLVVGHSAGAAIGANMCLQGMVSPSGLVSIGGAFMPIGGSKNGLFSLAAKLLAGNPIVSRIFAWRARDPSVVRELMGRTGSKIDEESYACYSRLARNPRHVSSALGMMANWNLQGLVGQLPVLETPLLILSGSKDGMIPISEGNKLQRLVPNSKLEIAKDCGHLIHEEAPALVAKSVRRFLRATQRIGA